MYALVFTPIFLNKLSTSYISLQISSVDLSNKLELTVIPPLPIS